MDAQHCLWQKLKRSRSYYTTVRYYLFIRTNVIYSYSLFVHAGHLSMSIYQAAVADDRETLFRILPAAIPAHMDYETDVIFIYKHNMFI